MSPKLTPPNQKTLTEASKTVANLSELSTIPAVTGLCEWQREQTREVKYQSRDARVSVDAAREGRRPNLPSADILVRVEIGNSRQVILLGDVEGEGAIVRPEEEGKDMVMRPSLEGAVEGETYVDLVRRALKLHKEYLSTACDPATRASSILVAELAGSPALDRDHGRSLDYALVVLDEKTATAHITHSAGIAVWKSHSGVGTCLSPNADVFRPTLVGILDPQISEEHKIPLQEGLTVVLASDGLSGDWSEDLEMIPPEVYSGIKPTSTADEVLGILKARLVGENAAAPLKDDVSLVLIRGQKDEPSETAGAWLQDR